MLPHAETADSMQLVAEKRLAHTPTEKKEPAKPQTQPKKQTDMWHC
jgi:hypothetical protein